MEINASEVEFYHIEFARIMPGDIPPLITESIPWFQYVAAELAKGAEAGKWNLPRSPYDYMALLAFHTLNYTIGQGTLLTDSLVCGYMGWIGRVLGLELRKDAPVTPIQINRVHLSLTIEESMQELQPCFQRLVYAKLFGIDSDVEAVQIVAEPEPKHKPRVIAPAYMRPNRRQRPN